MVFPTPSTGRVRTLAWLLIGCCALLLPQNSALAGGPILVGGPSFGVDGQPFTWDTSLGEVQYRTDGGGLGVIVDPNARVGAMFQVWEDVTTAAIGFNRAGSLLSVPPNFNDGDVSTMAEFNAVEGSCGSGSQNPIVYDQDGSLFDALFGTGTGVIGFAGICSVSSVGRIVSAEAALNGAFRDGIFDGRELSDNEFDAVFIHEFGHFVGLDHSQINLNCLTGLGCASFSDDTFGLPTMFPFLISGLQETPGVHPARTLAADDIAWVSRLYPEPSFATSHGTISGVILFSDGMTHVQGVNVIARDNANPRRIAVSVVSGFRFTANPGQSVTGTNTGGSTFGSRDPLRIGSYEIPVPAAPAGTSYTVEVESIDPDFVAGSSVGPLDPPIENPGADEFWNAGESNTDVPAVSSPVSVTPGAGVVGIDIILNGTPPRFDGLESACLWLPRNLTGGLLRSSPSENPTWGTRTEDQS